jgi:hypothetical protein
MFFPQHTTAPSPLIRSRPWSTSALSADAPAPPRSYYSKRARRTSPPRAVGAEAGAEAGDSVPMLLGLDPPAMARKPSSSRAEPKDLCQPCLKTGVSLNL